MSLKDNLELETTRAKVRLLEDRFGSGKKGGGDEHVRELSQKSLRRLINQLKEEIARFEAHVSHGVRD